MSEKVITSPIGYPGGKRKLFKEFWNYLPADTKEIVSPFFGGGAIELNCAARGIKVHGYDIMPWLVNFWQVWFLEAKNVLFHAKAMLRTNTRENLIKTKKNYFIPNILNMIECTTNPLYCAVLFYLMNHLSTCGTMYQGSIMNYYQEGNDFYEPSNIGRKSTIFPESHAAIGELTQGLPIRIKTVDFEESLSQHPDIFAYLDPPYVGTESLYACDFDHKKLFRILRRRENWILFYPDCLWVRKRYAPYEMREVSTKSGFRKDGKSKDIKQLMIFSQDISP